MTARLLCLVSGHYWINGDNWFCMHCGLRQCKTCDLRSRNRHRCPAESAPAGSA